MQQQSLRIADRYDVTRVLGRGGMAVVYEAVDRASDRRLALKQVVVPAGADAKRILALFQREYHTLVQLSHPCIVGVHDYGVGSAGPYYTMELLEGADLRAVAPLPWRQACALLRDVASALAAVHARRLVHRDINYRNVRRTIRGRAKLLDFGTLVTFGTASDVAGTAPFIAPEALRGQSLDARADLFSLGCLAYWLLTKRLPFDAPNNAELERLWAAGAPRIGELVPELPAAVDTLVGSLLQLDSLARPASAAEVTSQLAAVAGLDDDDALGTARAYLATPRIVGRTRELVRIRGLVSEHLRQCRERDDTIDRFRKQAPHTQRETRLSGTTADMGPRKSEGSFGAAVVVIEGPAGSGRSRMLKELCLEARLASAGVLEVSAGAVRAGPYKIAARLFEELRLERPQLAASLDRESQSLLEGLLDSPDPSREPSLDERLPVEEERARIATALRGLFEAAASGAGLVLAVDDAQRCDEPSVAALMSLVGRSACAPIMVALARDPEADTPTSKLVDWLAARAACIELRPLNGEQISELMQSLFARSDHIGKLSSWLQRVGGGSPLACMELLHHLVDQGTIRYDGAVWLLPEDPAAEGLPESVAAMLQARVDALSPSARQLAQLLSLFDAPLPIERCLELAEESVDGVFEAVDELVMHGLVVGGATHRLANEPLREVLRGSMDEALRAALHRRVGQMLVERGPRSTADVLDAAQHLIDGGEETRGAALLGKLGRTNPFFAAQGGPHASPLLERALAGSSRESASRRLALQIPLLIQAAYHDIGGARHGDAVLEQLRKDIGFALFEQATEPADPKRRLHASMHEAYRQYKVMPKHERGYQPLEALLRLSPCVLSLARVHALGHDLAAVQRLARVLDPYRHIEHPHAAGVQDTVLSVVATLQGREQLAHTRLHNVLQMLEHPVSPQLYPPLIQQLWRLETLAIVGIRFAHEHPQVLEHAQQLEATGFAVHQYEATLMRTLSHLYRGEQSSAERLSEQLEDLLLQQRGGWRHAGWLALVKTCAYMRLGDPLALTECSNRLDDLIGTFPGCAPFRQAAQAYRLHCVGDHAGALAGFDDLLSRFAPGEHEIWSHASRGRALCLVALTRYTEAEELIQQTLRRADEVGVRADRLRRPLAPLLLLCRAERGEPAAAAEALDALIDGLHEAGPLALMEAHCARAQVAALQRRPDLLRVSTETAARHVDQAESRALTARYRRWLDQMRRRGAALST